MKEKRYIDTHVHYTDRQFDSDRKKLMEELQRSFYAVVEIGCDLKTSESALKLSEEYDFVYCTIGIHPSDVKHSRLSDIDWIRKNASNNKVVAIGEIGLDHHWDKEYEPQLRQKRAFILQMQIAKENKLPIVIHSRDAAKDTMDIVKEHGKDLKGIMHCYPYSYEMAKDYVNMGYYLGIGGVVTYSNAPRLHEVVEKIPLEYLVLETDSPYLSPVPNRGKRNSSLNLTYVVEKIAELKKISVEEVLEQTCINAKNIYNLK